MRIYEYKCHQCGAELEAANRIDERRTHAPMCCGVQTSIEIRTPPRGYVDNMEEYLCPVTRQGVTTRRQRNNIMAEHCLVDANDMLTTWEKRQAKVEKVEAEKAKISKARSETPKEIHNHIKQVIEQEYNAYR